MLVWELTGAVIGAGMASGREIASFFARYGVWGIPGILLSVGTMICLADTPVPHAWRGSWIESAWRMLQQLLLICTSGAMLSGGGEIAALTLPLKGAYWWGIIGTMSIAWVLARRTASGLAWVSRLLYALMLTLLITGFCLPRENALHLESRLNLKAVLGGAAYGGFNAALQAPIILHAYRSSAGERKRTVCRAGMVIGAVLLLGYMVLRRHPLLIDESLPFIAMLSRVGKVGYILGGGCLYLAILSTLTACMRGLEGRLLPVMGMALVSLLGLTGVVEIAYPVLGGGCFLMMLAAKLVN